MNSARPSPSPLILLTALFGSLGFHLSAHAAATDLSDVPLAEASTVTVLPNIYFILDDSGSMDWDYMPDYVNDSYCRGNGTSLTGCRPGDPPYYSSAFNRVYYNPMVNYTPPVNDDGSSKTSYTTWTAVPIDGYRIQDKTGNTNLVTNYPERVACTGTTYSTTDCRPQIDASNNYSFPNSTYKNIVSKNGAPFYYNVTVEWCSQRESSGPRFGKAGTCQSQKTNTYQYVRYTNWERVDIVPSRNNYPGPNGTTRTYAEEMTNFANWYAWYRTRMQMAKTGIGQAFVNIRGTPNPNDPLDKNYFHARVGFSTISKKDTADGTKFLKIDNFDPPHKKTWFTRLYATIPTGGTPLLGALAKAGRIYAGKLAPDPVQYSCQRNFTILSSDGYWNSVTATYGPTKEDGSTKVGEQDGVTGVTRPSFDKNKTPDTLADVAFYYYHNDLRPGNCKVCTDNVPPAGTKNNEDDVALHQHMTTFTVGLGVDGTLVYQDSYKTSSTGDYQAIKQGTKDWPVVVAGTNDERKIDDLWHAAVNGRGTYFSARDPESLVKGLVTALGAMEASNGSGAAAATSNLDIVEGDNGIYIANYRTVQWDGELSAHTIDVSTGDISDTATWRAAAKLDAKTGPDSDSRTIYTVNKKTLIDFQYDKLSTEQKGYFNKNSLLSQYDGMSDEDKAKATPERLLKYLRGQNRYEDQDRPEGFDYSRLYRDRATVLGDVIHSQPVYVRNPRLSYTDPGYAAFKADQTNRAPTVYLSANDGMLHAFDGDIATGGSERWAFVPPMVMDKMWTLADKNYANNHKFLVDGPLAVGDISTGANWKTVLIGALGKGGRGYYALDITDPATPKFLWTFSAEDDPDLGYSYGRAVITKVEGTWVALIPSGYNNIPEGGKYASATGKGYLFVVNAATGQVIKKIATGVGSVSSPSGLGRINPKVDDIGTDNTAKFAYGGDLEGNLWRFDLVDGSASAVISLGSTQPITATPEIGEISGKTVLYFGTGRYLGQSDLSNNDQQALYAVKDVEGKTVAKTDLIQQTITGDKISNNSVNWTEDGGWYVNLPDPKERSYLAPILISGTVIFASTIPEATECSPGGYSHLYMVDYQTGGSVDGDKKAVYTLTSPIVGISVFRLPDGTIKVIPVTADGAKPQPLSVSTSSGGGGSSGGNFKRMMWRELID
ncbi:pilus assembly protein [Azovibrio restrictus]|uniref:pilus assembly protein n=1 Tax=Azovibrio restrictus TaxID=146938 RepID=UPI0026EF85C2|nr:PilC/PilY family type IV pilus protein [Azovibrio restrictus]